MTVKKSYWKRCVCVLDCGRCDSAFPAPRARTSGLAVSALNRAKLRNKPILKFATRCRSITNEKPPWLKFLNQTHLCRLRDPRATLSVLIRAFVSRKATDD